MVPYITANQIPLTFDPPSAFMRVKYKTLAENAMALNKPKPPMVQLDIHPEPQPNTNDPGYQIELEAWRQQIGYVMFNLAVAVALSIDPDQRDAALADHHERMNAHADDLGRLADVLSILGNSDKVNEYESYATTISQCFGGDHPNVQYVIQIACRDSMVDLINVRHIMAGAWEEADVQQASAGF